MEIQNLINCIENNGLHYITCRLQMTWGQSDKVELSSRIEGSSVILMQSDLKNMPEDSKTLQVVEVLGRESREKFSEYSFAATKTQTHILDIPQSISTVTKEVIEEQGLVRLNEIATTVSGVNEFSVYDDLTIRGFRNYDDRRVNGLRTYNNFWSQPNIAHLERVEVIKGPGAAIFGDASPGGVINLVTKKPLTDSHQEVRAIFGSFNQKYIAGDITGPLNKEKNALYRLNVGIEDSDSFRDQKFYKNYTIAPSVTLLPTDSTKINLDLVYTDAKSILDRGQPNIRNSNSLGVVPINVNLTQPGDRLNTKNLAATLSFEQKLTESLVFAFSHLYNKYNERMNEHGHNSYISDSIVDLYYNDRHSNANIHSSSAYLSGRFKTQSS